MGTRKVITDTDLLHGLASGVVYNPFDKRLHDAACPSIGRMRASASNPKWHFAEREDAEVYLADHYARWGGAKWEAAGCCLRDAPGRPRTEPLSVSVPRLAAIREPVVQRRADGFEVWSEEHVHNESKASSAAGALRRLISAEIRRLPPPAGRLLGAAYAGDRWPGKDVENLLFNDIDQMLSLFAAPGASGIRFEDLGRAFATAPDGWRAPSYYSYRLVELGQPFAGIELGELACHVPEAIVPDGPARLAARVWLAVRRARPSSWDGIPSPDPYVLRVRASGLPAARSLKAIIDGASAALQQGARGTKVRLCAERLELLLGIPREEVLGLITASAPLGHATQLFTPDGVAQVRVTPNDERCVAAEIVAADVGGPPRLTVNLHAAKWR